MKIVHCCFGSETYIDDWGYQQNLLPEYHTKLGHQVTVISSSDVFTKRADQNKIKEIKSKGTYYNKNLLKIRRIPSRFRKFKYLHKAKGLYDTLKKEKPDIIFFHGIVNLSVLSCYRYVKYNKTVSLFIDNHGDLQNISKNKLYQQLYYKLIWKNIHRFIKSNVKQYFGVTIGRCDFLKEFLGIPNDKISLLPIGADVDSYKSIGSSKLILREKYGIKEDEIIIIHGGKLDKSKGTVDLIKAFYDLKKNHISLKLILFGRIDDNDILRLLSNDILTFDWLSRSQTFEIMKIADLAIWPIHHTTLIEDCIAANLPYLIRKTTTTEHLIKSNFFLRSGNYEEIKEQISFLLTSNNLVRLQNDLKEIKSEINYYSIAQKVIDYHNQN